MRDPFLLSLPKQYYSFEEKVWVWKGIYRKESDKYKTRCICALKNNNK
jgi:hypothetical protein